MPECVAGKGFPKEKRNPQTSILSTVSLIRPVQLNSFFFPLIVWNLIPALDRIFQLVNL